MSQREKNPAFALAAVGVGDLQIDLSDSAQEELTKLLQAGEEAIDDNFKNTLSVSERQMLVEGALGLTLKVAGRIVSSLKARYRFEVSDLAQDGAIGLLDASERFDPKRGISFEAFASKRVRGAIIDRLRREIWPRDVRRLRRKLENARQELRSRLGWDPSAEGFGFPSWL